MAASNSNNGQYVYKMDYLPRRDLCRILDNDKMWEELAGLYMGFTVQDIKEIARARSPTDSLLERWGQRNHTINELFVLLSKMQHYQAMEVLKPYVDEKYRILIPLGEVNLTEQLRKELDKSKSRKISKEASSDTGTPDCKPAIDPRNLNVSVSDQSIGSKDVVSRSQTNESQNSIDNSHVNVYQKAESSRAVPAAQAVAASPPNNSTVLKDVVASFAALNVFHIDLSELETATQNWDPAHLLGRGGFGTVFRGTWKNTQVAIKRMELKGLDGADFVPLKQSAGELRILNSYRHDNILPLYGYSFKAGSNPCLVYQYMPNGSLEDRLLRRQNTPPLSWDQRLNIARGTARGLQFLHTTGEKPLIHGDIKSANILLDRNFEPKIGDFGLAREGPQTEFTHMQVSRVHGTKPYLPSEYLRGRKISVKVDTYSFGIVLYELCTGLRAYDSSRTYQYLKDFVENSDDLQALIDTSAPSEGSEAFGHFMEIGRNCAEHNPRDRPEMVKVYQRLDELSLPAPAVSRNPGQPAESPGQFVESPGASGDVPVSLEFSGEYQLPNISLLGVHESSGNSQNSLLPDFSKLEMNSGVSSSSSDSRKLPTREKSLPIFN